MGNELSFVRTVMVRKPVSEVYAAIVDPAQLTRYFVDEASGPLETGKTVMWRWEEMSDETHCEEAVENERLVLTWKPYKVTDYSTRCTITFEAADGDATKVRLAETGWRADDTGIASAIEHSAGWAHMLLCLRAYLEHGLDLRR